MQIPDNAAVKSFEDADLGSLLVGRFSDEQPNFVAIRTERRDPAERSEPWLAVLTPWAVRDEELPFLCSPAVESPKVLDLGNLGRKQGEGKNRVP